MLELKKISIKTYRTRSIKKFTQIFFTPNANELTQKYMNGILKAADVAYHPKIGSTPRRMKAFLYST